MWLSTPLHFGPFFSLDICYITDKYMMEWFRSRTRIWHRACATGFRCRDYPSHCQQWGRLCGAFLRGFSQDFGFRCIGCWNFPQRRGKAKRTVMEFGGIRKKSLNRLVASSCSLFKDFNRCGHLLKLKGPRAVMYDLYTQILQASLGLKIT